MTEDEDYQTFKARLKERTKHAADACMLPNQMWGYPCDEKMCLPLKNCCSVKLWTNCMAIMDLNSLEFEFLTAAEAMKLMDTAQEKIDVYTKNKTALPPRNATTPKKTPAAGTPAAGQTSQAGNESGTGSRVPFKELMPGSIRRACKFNHTARKGHLGVICPYQHLGQEVQQEAAAVKKLAEKLAAEKIVAAQGKDAEAPPATGRSGIQIPKPNAKTILMMIKSDSSGAEGVDCSSSSEPEDQMQWLFRVSGGRQGLPEENVRCGMQTVAKPADGTKYSGNEFAVIGDQIDWGKLKEHDAEMVMDS